MGRHMWARGGDVVHVPGGGGSGRGHGGGGGDSGDGILTVIMAIVLLVAVICGICWMFSSVSNFITGIILLWIIRKCVS